MIQIDTTEKTIRFIPEPTEDEHPPERSLPLLSAYVCPSCKKILAAYFQGWLSDADIAHYEKQKPGYRIGSVPGGHYVKPEHHQGYSYGDDGCIWEEYTRRGIVENVRLFVQRHELSRMLIQPLSEKIGLIPGFRVVADICGRDREMLLFSEDKLFGELRRKDFDAYWKMREKMGEYLLKLVKERG